jgi:hypothetical protein
MATYFNRTVVPALAVASMLTWLANGLAQEVGPAESPDGSSEQRIQAEQAAIIQLQRQLLELRESSRHDDGVIKRIEELEHELADRTRFLEWWAPSPSADADVASELSKKIKAKRERIASAERWLNDAAAEHETSGRDPQADADFVQVTKELVQLKKQLEELLAEQRARNSPDERIAQLQSALAAREKQFAELTLRYQEMVRDIDESQRARELPKLENATIKVFRLKSLQASAAADTIVAILGERDVRVAPDERANALVVAADEESAKLIEALLLQLDGPAAEEPEGQPGAADGAHVRSLLLRTFWLADGLPEGEGEDAAKFLPASVLQAMSGLGLNEPRLVCQTVNALSGDDQTNHVATFDTNVPALLFKQQAQLKCKGAIRALREGRAEVEATIEVQSPTLSTQLSGSLAMPLGHYMVLGTANSVSFDPAMMGEAGMAMGIGMEGGGYGGESGGRGRGEFGRGGFGGRGTDGGRGAAVDPAIGEIAAPSEPQYNTSHFAFVVQINEAESFTDEK